MIVSKLSKYMTARAAHEGVEWALSDEFLQEQFDAGFRNFFGVELDDTGALLADRQQPEFFRASRSKEVRLG